MEAEELAALGRNSSGYLLDKPLLLLWCWFDPENGSLSAVQALLVDPHQPDPGEWRCPHVWETEPQAPPRQAAELEGSIATCRACCRRWLRGPAITAAHGLRGSGPYPTSTGIP